mmetsp:Transcript_72247/g.188439  ORF Transcript_72247/g.188439 Transcript_72247/m.188439 type:complete len:208 (-) Transcript_72247:79-702(-)
MVLGGINLPVLPSENALAVHTAVPPLSSISPAVCPRVDALAVHLVLRELSNVAGAVRQSDLAVAVLEAVLVQAAIRRRVWPNLLAHAHLLVLEPLPVVGHAARLLKAPPAARHVRRPLALVAGTVRVVEHPVPAHLVVLPVAGVEILVGPLHLALSVHLFHQHGTPVDATRLEHNGPRLDGAGVLCLRRPVDLRELRHGLPLPSECS